jgi:hypothetical protein
MSNQSPRFRSPDERRRTYREQYLDRYFAPEDGQGMSPLVIAILILAVFTCLFICAILMMIPFRLLSQ